MDAQSRDAPLRQVRVHPGMIFFCGGTKSPTPVEFFFVGGQSPPTPPELRKGCAAMPHGPFAIHGLVRLGVSCLSWAFCGFG